LSPDEVQKLSVAEISSETPYDDYGNPKFNGVNDPRLGTNSRDLRCITCKGSK
jgi:DNA-directed RNA polymerase beta' subunit